LYLAGNGPRSSMPNTATGCTIESVPGRDDQASVESGLAATHANANRASATRRLPACVAVASSRFCLSAMVGDYQYLMRPEGCRCQRLVCPQRPGKRPPF
jgi:hypothetical protein